METKHRKNISRDDMARIHDELAYFSDALVDGVLFEVKVVTKKGKYDSWELYADGKKIGAWLSTSLEPLNLAGGIIEGYILRALTPRVL